MPLETAPTCVDLSGFVYLHPRQMGRASSSKSSTEEASRPLKEPQQASSRTCPGCLFTAVGLQFLAFRMSMQDFSNQRRRKTRIPQFSLISITRWKMSCCQQQQTISSARIRSTYPCTMTVSAFPQRNPETAEEVCNKLQEHVKQTTGFDVVMREKVHRTVLQIILEEATSKRVSVLSPNSVLRGTGNCIPAAVSLLLERTSDVEQAVVADSQGQGAESRAPTRPSTRSYRECEKLLGVNLSLIFLRTTRPQCNCSRVISCCTWKNGGTPHCVGLCVPDDLSLEITVLDASNNISIQTSSLDSALRDGVDGITCILFNVTHAEKQISPHTCWEPDGLEGCWTLKLVLPKQSRFYLRMIVQRVSLAVRLRRNELQMIVDHVWIQMRRYSRTASLLRAWSRR